MTNQQPQGLKRADITRLAASVDVYGEPQVRQPAWSSGRGAVHVAVTPVGDNEG